MSRNIWVISDTHFNHANILSFVHTDGSLVRGDRFKDVDHMNETMIENWNRVVQQGDIVYHLGDVVFGNNKDEWMDRHWPRLNGRKRLVLGNHDDPKKLAPYFQKIMLWREFHEHGLLLSHVPLDPSGLYRQRHAEKWGQEQLLNIHGHIHQHQSPTIHHRCVCVEQIDYTPVNLEDLAIC